MKTFLRYSAIEVTLIVVGFFIDLTFFVVLFVVLLSTFFVSRSVFGLSGRSSLRSNHPQPLSSGGAQVIAVRRCWGIP